ncbi:MAG: hypothetical protein AAGA48_29980 [Myxococcota bacterium]
MTLHSSPKPVTACGWRRVLARGDSGRWLFGPAHCTADAALVVLDREAIGHVWLYHAYGRPNGVTLELLPLPGDLGDQAPLKALQRHLEALVMSPSPAPPPVAPRPAMVPTPSRRPRRSPVPTPTRPRWKRTHRRGAAGRWLYGPDGCHEPTALVIIDRVYATEPGAHGRPRENRGVWQHTVRVRNPRTGELTEHRLWGELGQMLRPPIRSIQAWAVKRLNGRHPSRMTVSTEAPAVVSP